MVQVRKDWAARVTKFRGSGKTVTEWCKENEIKTHQLYYWLEKYPREPSSSARPPGWMTVQVKEEQVLQNSMAVRIGHAVIEVNTGFDPELLGEVVRTLSALC